MTKLKCAPAAFIFILAVTVRALFLFLAPGRYSLFGDTLEYIEVAKKLCQSGAYPFEHIYLPTFRAPGFPLLIALFSGCSYFAEWWLKTCLIFLDSAGALLGAGAVFYLSRENKTKRALIFGALYACYPLFVQESITIQSEVPALVSIVAGIYFLVKAANDSSISKAILSGVVFGFGILTRPSALLLIVFAVAALPFSTKSFRKVLYYLNAGIFFILAPWSIYATLNTGKLTLVNDSLCYSFYRGSHPLLLDVYTASDENSFTSASEKSEAAFREAESGDPAKNRCKAGYELLSKNPKESMHLSLLKWWAFFRPWPHSGAHSTAVVFIVGSMVTALYLLFFVLLFQKGSGRTERLIKIAACTFLLAISISHVPHQVSNRYRVPWVDPVIMILAAAYLRSRRPTAENLPD